MILKGKKLIEEELGITIKDVVFSGEDAGLAEQERKAEMVYEADMTADKPAAAIKKAADNIIPEGATELDPSDIVTASTRKEGEKIKIQTQSNKAAETVEEAIDDCAGGDF